MEERLIIFSVFIVLFTMIYVFTLFNQDDSFVLELAPVGEIYMPNKRKSVMLDRYMVDSNLNLYSVNPDTWEVNPKDNRDMLLCSNKAFDRSGFIVNSIYDKNGQKVTLRRKDLNFKRLANVNGTVTLVANYSTPRHIKIVTTVYKSFKQKG